MPDNVKFVVGDRIRFKPDQIKEYGYLPSGELIVVEVDRGYLRTRTPNGRSFAGYYTWRFDKIEQDGPW